MHSAKELAWLCRSAALLLHSGIGLAEGFGLLAREECFLDGLETLEAALEEGIPLWEALEKTGSFPGYLCSLVRIGEETGRLEEALLVLAEYYEGQERTRQQIRSAVAYPSVLFLLMLAVLGVLLVKVLPVFAQVYGSFGVRISGAAAAMLHLGQLAGNAMPVLFGLLLILAAAVLAYSLCGTFRDWTVRTLQKRFGDRGIARKFNNAHFVQGLSMGFQSGLPLDQAARLAENLLEGKPQAVRRMEACTRALEEGLSVREAMDRGQLLSPVQSRMLGLGLRSGAGEQVLQSLVQQLQEEANQALDRVVSRLEPAMVLTGSLLVGMILLAVMLPLLDILWIMG